jgi:hypothetical protein
MDSYMVCADLRQVVDIRDGLLSVLT